METIVLKRKIGGPYDFGNSWKLVAQPEETLSLRNKFCVFWTRIAPVSIDISKIQRIGVERQDGLFTVANVYVEHFSHLGKIANVVILQKDHREREVYNLKEELTSRGVPLCEFSRGGRRITVNANNVRSVQPDTDPCCKRTKTKIGFSQYSSAYCTTWVDVPVPEAVKKLELAKSQKTPAPGF